MAGRPNAAELDMLTDEEREGMLDEDTVDEGLEDGDDGAGEGGDDTAAAAADDAAGKKDDEANADAANGDDDGNGDDDDAGKPDTTKADDAAAAAASAAADDTAAPVADETPAAAAIPDDRAPSWVLDPKVGEQIEALEKKKDELTEKADDGELTFKEFRTETRKIDAQLEELKEQRMAANIGKTNAFNHYKDVTVPEFFAEHKQYEKGSILYTMLDAEVRKLQAQSQNPLNPALLELAHKNITDQVTKAYGVKPQEQKQQKDNKKPPARDVVPTLGSVPAADANDADDGGEFGWLDRLGAKDHEAYEIELAKLSDEKRERYLAE